MQTLRRGSEISAAQAILSRAIQFQVGETIPTTIGFQSGSTDAQVYFIPSIGIWAFFGDPPNEKSPGDRYWNIFGIGRPSRNVSIACEINPAKDGLNRRVGGLFVVDSSGRTWLAHRGNFNARGRIPFRYTRSNFRWLWQTILDGTMKTEVMIIAPLDSPDLVKKLGEFAYEAARFKETARHCR